jgi:hypothetical protein
MPQAQGMALAAACQELIGTPFVAIWAKGDISGHWRRLMQRFLPTCVVSPSPAASRRPGSNSLPLGTPGFSVGRAPRGERAPADDDGQPQVPPRGKREPRSGSPPERSRVLPRNPSRAARGRSGRSWAPPRSRLHVHLGRQNTAARRAAGGAAPAAPRRSRSARGRPMPYFTASRLNFHHPVPRATSRSLSGSIT